MFNICFYSKRKSGNEEKEGKGVDTEKKGCVRKRNYQKM